MKIQAHMQTPRNTNASTFLSHMQLKKLNLIQKQVTFSRAEQFGPIDHNHNKVRVNFDDDYTL